MRQTITPGEAAYIEDCSRKPLYYPRVDGAVIARVTWGQLDAVARWSWERNPTPREW